ncbi:MAG: hypothetical protein LAN59_03625 [Acidobacteriia bacterium]|nr:hypothetical protein [Terriglobia bacterium]
MSPKHTTTISPPAASKKSAAAGPDPADLTAKWTEARLVYPIYAALATQFHFAPLPYPPGEVPPARPTRKIFDRDTEWLHAIDEKVLAYQIRQLPSEILNAHEESLRALVHRQLRAPEKTNTDRDKIDFLLVQYFAMCAPEEMYHSEITLEDVARILQPVLAGADATPLEWCEPLEQILANIAECVSLRDMMEGGLLEQGRMVKDSAGHMFYDPAALVAFCRFNFLLRRAFIRMLHTDLSAMRQAVGALEARGVKTVDCRRAGFSAAETTAELRRFCENWRPPFQKDYAENSVSRALEQLMALRTDLEEALGSEPSDAQPDSFFAPEDEAPTPAAKKTAPSPAARPAPAKAAPPPAPAASAHPPAAKTPPAAPAPSSARPAAPAKPQARAAAPPAANAPAGTAKVQKPVTKQGAAAPAMPAAPSAPRPPKPPAAMPAEPTASAEAEKCLEAIWEQLIAAPPTHGRSMSTVVLQNTKILLSAWEVAAFVSDGGQESEDLRRAVVARALLAVATDLRTRSGEADALASALSLARSEVSYFQGRVEQAKRAKNTEAAVNLGISTKRLLSFMEEADKLRP